MAVIDLFGGARGWDVGARSAGLEDALGIDIDEAACATSEAAGFPTLRADVAELDPLEFGPCERLIGSPPCQARSMAGKRGGERDLQHVFACLRDLAAGRDTRAQHLGQCEDRRSMLVVEPLRWALALMPARIALEQVPPVLEEWKMVAQILRSAGYRTWTGILSAERYGVPQTRKRAILMASLDGPVHPPAPTHQAYVKGEPARHVQTFDGDLLPWVSMAEALGFGMETPAPTLVTTRRSADGLLVGRSLPPGAGRNVGGRNWPTHYDRRQGQTRNGKRTMVPLVPVTEPAPTIAANGLAKGRDRWLRNNSNANASRRHLDEPAPTLFFGHSRNEVGWVSDPEARVNHDGERITLQQAAVLQGFPADYPFQGSRTKRDEQVGNAVPPPLGAAVLGALIPQALSEAA